MCPQADLTLLSAPDASSGWQAFGQVAVLDLVFDQTDRPSLVSAVLAASAPKGVTAVDIWAMPLAVRIGGLLQIWARTTGQESLDMVFRCPAGCGADLEIELPVPALMELAKEALVTPETTIKGPPRVVIRRPTGADQRAWLAAKPRDVQATILADLVVSGTIDPAHDLSAALADFDPLTCFIVTTTCPDCSTESDLAVDLEAHVLQALAREQTRLFAQVDALARRYGWRDSEILAMPAARRARYLAMSQSEAAW